MTEDEVNQHYLSLAVAMFPSISDKPFVHVDAEAKDVLVCRSIFGLRVEEGVVLGECDWVQPAEKRPDSLTDRLAIGSDLLDVGIDWWLDMYFDWFLVFDAELVAKATADDLTWVEEFLSNVRRHRTIPRPPPGTDSTHLLPKDEAPEYYG